MQAEPEVSATVSRPRYLELWAILDYKVFSTSTEKFTSKFSCSRRFERAHIVVFPALRYSLHRETFRSWKLRSLRWTSLAMAICAKWRVSMVRECGGTTSSFNFAVSSRFSRFIIRGVPGMFKCVCIYLRACLTMLRSQITTKRRVTI